MDSLRKQYFVMPYFQRAPVACDKCVSSVLLLITTGKFAVLPHMLVSSGSYFNEYRLL